MVTHESWAVAALKAVAIAFHPWVFRAAVPVLVLALLSRRADRLAWWAAIQDDRRRHARVRAQAGDGPGTPQLRHADRHCARVQLSVRPRVCQRLCRTRVPARDPSGAAKNAGAGGRVGSRRLDRVHCSTGSRSGFTTSPMCSPGGWSRPALVAAFETWRRDAGRRPHDPIEGVDPDEAGRLT
jgi:hypothetical protein